MRKKLPVLLLVLIILLQAFVPVAYAVSKNDAQSQTAYFCPSDATSKGTGKAVDSLRGLLKKAKLPTDGRFRFMADGKDLKFNKSLNGYVDRFGNIWKKGPYHGDPSKGFTFEWDVQLSEQGMKAWGKFTKNSKNYINVAPDGSLSH